MQGYGFAVTLTVSGAELPDGSVRHYYCTSGSAKVLLCLVLFNVFMKLLTRSGCPEIYWNTVPETIMESVES